MFYIGQVRFDFDGLGIDDFGRNFDAFLKLRHMEDVMNGC
jgi:glutaredoxin-related protein